MFLPFQVMKKNKLSNVPSENSSPLLGRREFEAAEVTGSVTTSPSSREGSAEKQSPTEQNNYETIERKTTTTTTSVTKRNNRDPGYETIPGEKCRRDLLDSLNAAEGGSTKSRNSAPAGE